MKPRRMKPRLVKPRLVKPQRIAIPGRHLLPLVLCVLGASLGACTGQVATPVHPPLRDAAVRRPVVLVPGITSLSETIFALKCLSYHRAELRGSEDLMCT